MAIHCFFIHSFHSLFLSFIQNAKELSNPWPQHLNWQLERGKRESTTLKQIGGWDWESDRLEKLNPGSRKTDWQAAAG